MDTVLSVLLKAKGMFPLQGGKWIPEKKPQILPDLDIEALTYGFYCKIDQPRAK